MADTLDLVSTYLHLDDGPGVRRIEVDADFWARLQERKDLQSGRMVGMFAYDSDWTSWEVHPAGDEIVLLMSGELTLILDNSGVEERLHLDAGRTAIVPGNVWHTADVHQPARALHITRGAGTLNRPRKRSPDEQDNKA